MYACDGASRQRIPPAQSNEKGEQRTQPAALTRSVKLDEPVSGSLASAGLGQMLEGAVVEDHDLGGYRQMGGRCGQDEKDQEGDGHHGVVAFLRNWK